MFRWVRISALETILGSIRKFVLGPGADFWQNRENVAENAKKIDFLRSDLEGALEASGVVEVSSNPVFRT